MRVRDGAREIGRELPLHGDDNSSVVGAIMSFASRLTDSGHPDSYARRRKQKRRARHIDLAGSTRPSELGPSRTYRARRSPGTRPTEDGHAVEPVGKAGVGAAQERAALSSAYVAPTRGSTLRQVIG